MNQMIPKQSTAPLNSLEGQQAEAMRLQREADARCSPEELMNAVEMLMASFPHLKPADPKGYVETMVAHLSKYPSIIVQRIIDPRSGVVTRTKFPPVIAEIAEFAEPLWAEHHQALRRAKGAVAQLSTPTDMEIPEAERKAIAEGLRDLSKQLGQSMSMKNAGKRKPHPRTRCASGEAIRKHMGMDPVKDAPSG